MKLTIPENQHRSRASWIAAHAADLAGLHTNTYAVWHVRFHQPETYEHADGKLCGRTRGLAPFRRLTNPTLGDPPNWRELVNLSHEESDRILFNMASNGVWLKTYGYQGADAPYADQDGPADMKPLCRVSYGEWHELLLQFGQKYTHYEVGKRIQKRGPSPFAIDGEAVVQHSSNWNGHTHKYGALLRPYAGSADWTPNCDLRIDVKRVA